MTSADYDVIIIDDETAVTDIFQQYMSVLKKLFYRGEREERREKLKTRFKNSY